MQIATAPDPSLRSVALGGRRIAEVVFQALSQAPVPETDAAQDLEIQLDIEELEGPVEPELQFLFAQGRTAASGGAVDWNDAMLIVRAALRVVERTVR